MIEHKCYYIELNNELEAHYLCALLGVKSLQKHLENLGIRHWISALILYGRSLFPSSMLSTNYTLNWLIWARAELIAASVPLFDGATKTRGMIRDRLREDGVSDEIDRCVRDLLPGYAV